MIYGYIPVAGNIYERRRQDDVPAASAQFYVYMMPLANFKTYQIGLTLTDIAHELGLSRQIVSKHLLILHEKQWLTYTKNHPAYVGGLITLHVGLWDLEKKKKGDLVGVYESNRTDNALVNDDVNTSVNPGVKGDVKNLNISVGTPLPLRGQAIAETQAPLDVERSASVNQLTTETKSTDHVSAGSVLFNPVEEGKEGNDKESDELSELDKRALLIWDEEFIQDELWMEMNEDEKLNLIVSFESDDPTDDIDLKDLEQAEHDGIDENYHFPIPCPVCNNPLVYKHGRVNCTDCDWSFGYRVFKKRLMLELDNDNSFPADVAAQNRGDLSRLLGGLTAGEDAVVDKTAGETPAKASMEETLRRLRRMDLSAGITYKEDS